MRVGEGYRKIPEEEGNILWNDLMKIMKYSFDLNFFFSSSRWWQWEVTSGRIAWWVTWRWRGQGSCWHLGQGQGWGSGRGFPCTFPPPQKQAGHSREQSSLHHPETHPAWAPSPVPHWWFSPRKYLAQSTKWCLKMSGAKPEKTRKPLNGTLRNKRPSKSLHTYTKTNHHPRANKLQNKTYHANSLAMQTWVSTYRLPKVTPNTQTHRKTHYWTPHCTPERRNLIPRTKTLTQVSLTRKPWQTNRPTPPTG